MNQYVLGVYVQTRPKPIGLSKDSTQVCSNLKYKEQNPEH